MRDFSCISYVNIWDLKNKTYKSYHVYSRLENALILENGQRLERADYRNPKSAQPWEDDHAEYFRYYLEERERFAKAHKEKEARRSAILQNMTLENWTEKMNELHNAFKMNENNRRMQNERLAQKIAQLEKIMQQGYFFYNGTQQRAERYEINDKEVYIFLENGNKVKVLNNHIGL